MGDGLGGDLRVQCTVGGRMFHQVDMAATRETLHERRVCGAVGLKWIHSGGEYMEER